MMKKLLFVAIFVFSVATSFANNIAEKSSPVVYPKGIQGKVIDKITGEALAGVALQLQGSKSIIYTDFEGNFSINGVAPGTYELNVKFVSYQGITLKEIITDKAEVKLKVELESLSPNI